jgi:hypothetical protein
MKKSTKLYRQVEELLSCLPDVEEEWITSQSKRSREQLSRVADRLCIMQEVITGMLSN